jgi:preprotein translocase subunit YajC
MEWVSTIGMLVVMIAIFYFMLIRPENKKKKQLEELRSSLAVGDEVTTISGVVGTVCAVKPNSIVIETGADRVRLELMKWAISTKGVQTTEGGEGESSKSAKK